MNGLVSMSLHQSTCNLFNFNTGRRGSNHVRAVPNSRNDKKEQPRKLISSKFGNPLIESQTEAQFMLVKSKLILLTASNKLYFVSILIRCFIHLSSILRSLRGIEA